MKIKDIYDLEYNNNSMIFLIRDGNFYRAYERPALFFVENVATYHLLKREYKVINAEMVYLGFPQTNLSKLLEEKNLKLRGKTSNYLVMGPFSAKGDFEQWKASILCQTREEDECRLMMQERVLPRFEDDHPLHIYKLGNDCMVEIYKLVENMKRGYKYSVGEELKKDAFQLGLITFRMAKYKAKDADRPTVREALRQVDVVRLRLRLLQELHQLSVNAFTRINTQIEYLVTQLGKE